MTKFKIISLWLIVLSPFIGLFSLVYLTSIGVFGDLATLEELENPENNLATEIISEDGVLLGVYATENRSRVKRNEISENLINALIATEDIRFREHSGIDGRALLRAVAGMMGKSSGGASTITQQLVKNWFTNKEKEKEKKEGKPTIVKDENSNQYVLTRGMQKLKEWVIAVQLEKRYTKDEIITMYFNTVEFGQLTFGIKSASKTFFGVEPKELSVEQSAVLVGLLKAPTRYSPFKNYDRSLKRRNVVLSQMNKYDFISDSLYDALKNTPIVLDFHSSNHSKGLAPYFRQSLRLKLTAKKPDKETYIKNSESYSTNLGLNAKKSAEKMRQDMKKFEYDYNEWANNPIYGWCEKNKKKDGSYYNIYTDGLKIHTTINSRLQGFAEEAMRTHISSLQKDFYAHWKGRIGAPYSKKRGKNLSFFTKQEYESHINAKIKKTDRYKKLNKAGKSLEEITTIFNDTVKMKVFSWNGEIDTTLTPLDSIKYYTFFLHSGMMSMDPKTGHVKAYVGGINHKYFQIDHVKRKYDSREKNQVGSTFKPFLYALAFEGGTSPCKKVLNVPIVFDKNIWNLSEDWKPPNSGGATNNDRHLTLKFGLANSINTITAYIMKQFGPNPVIDLAKRMGITSDLPATPSLCLGVPTISVYEMVGAYSTFVNKGTWTEPISVTRIEDKNGVILESFTPNSHKALNEETAGVMVRMLQGVVNTGTAVRLKSQNYPWKFKNELGGKTGTTNDQADGWFMGITPNLVTGVWTGCLEDKAHFLTTNQGQGANMALPIFAEYMQRVYDDILETGIKREDVFDVSKSADERMDCGEATHSIGGNEFDEEF